MRILWASNAPWNPSGYGMQTAQVVRRLVRDGHEVAVAANYGLNGSGLRWDGIPVFPNGFDAYGNDVLPYLYRQWADGKPTLLMTLYDVWVYNSNHAFDDLPIASWVPIDHMPVSPEVLAFARKHWMVAMSRFGETQLKEAGVPSIYVPHAIETADFQPRSSNFRRIFNIPDSAFVVMVNAANRDKLQRKAWAEMLAAFAVVASERPDMYLYLHTTLADPAGISLPVLLTSLGIDPDRVRVAPQEALRLGEIRPTDLAEAYTACDVLMAVSRGEGFGIPVIEAQACGLPVIVSDATAQPELCGAGWTTKTQAGWDFTQGAWWGDPSVASIIEALRAAYDARGDAALRERAVAFAQQYDADVVFDAFWRPALRELETRLTPAPRSRAERRAEQRAARKRGKAA